MKLCIVGTGYVGLVTGTCFADLGNKVYCVDKDKVKIKKLSNSISPIYESGLDDLIRNNLKGKRLIFTDNFGKAVQDSQIIFICVGTPTRKRSNLVDLSQVLQVAREMSKYIKSYKTIVIKSTVPITTGNQVEKILKKRVKKNLFDVISNPEFLREGEAIRDFRFPDRIVVGSDNKKVFKKMKFLYEPLIKKGAKFFCTSRRGAELIKYASNAFLATKITFINEIANLCEKIGVNVEDISVGMGSDVRIGSRFLRAGPAYGGSCFPKDTKGLLNTAKKFNISLSIIKSTVLSNNQRHKILFDKICKIMNGNISKKKIAFLGVTFKPNTDDMRESPALKLIPKLHKNGAIISYYDPSGMKNNFVKYKNVNFVNKISLACKNSDLVILHTEWNEFRNLNFKKLVKKNKFVIYDMRNIYSHKKKVNRNINYYGIGR